MSETALEIIAERIATVNDNLVGLSRDWLSLRLEVRREIRQRTLSLWCAMVLAVVVIILIGVAALTVGQGNRQAIDENNRRWCPLVALLVPRRGEPAPTTERGRIVAERATELYQEFRCG